MRLKRLLPHTRRQAAEGLSGANALLVRAGYIRQVEQGLFILGPLAFRVWQKLRNIIFAEMENDGVLNINMPILQPQALWEQTGRWGRYTESKTMLTTRNYHKADRMYGLAPTAEEVVTWLAATEIKSADDMPTSFHQIGMKMRCETRPHGGLLRGIEFDMSDAYSFDRDEAGMRASFDMFRAMYHRIFNRVGLRRFIAVQADSGAIGGKGSAEFMAISEEVGEDVLITCPVCNFGANLERANSRYPASAYNGTPKSRRIELTPDTKSVDQLVALFANDNLSADRMIKTIILTVSKGGETYEVAVCMRGDLEINLVKVRNALGADEVEPAEAETVVRATGAQVGFAGPIGLTGVRQILFDESTAGMVNFLCGLNKTNYHALDANFGAEDLPEPTQRYNLHQAKAGHGCPECADGILEESHGIEVGHIFMLQTGYAAKMGATYRDSEGNDQTIWMGCYGIGVTRLLQTIVEQSRDDKGIIWPESIAPFRVTIVPAVWTNPVQQALAVELYDALRANGIEVLLDDRDLRIGEKFNDADLLGMPWRITVGRDAEARQVELFHRADGVVEKLSVEDVLARFQRS